MDIKPLDQLMKPDELVGVFASPTVVDGRLVIKNLSGTVAIQRMVAACDLHRDVPEFVRVLERRAA